MTRWIQQIPWITTVTLLLALAAGCADRPDRSARPNVLVILIDALRADHLGCYGYERDTSPQIDALARESLVFVNSHAQSPWTKPSVPTLFTSLYPIQHGVYEGETKRSDGALESDILGEQFTTLAEVFRDAGYQTAAFVNNAHLAASQGFAQGFEIYEHSNFGGDQINQGALHFLDDRGPEPFFLYLHYLDAHWPFQPGSDFEHRFPGADRGGLFSRSDWKGLRKHINKASIALAQEDVKQLIALHDGALAELDAKIGELMDQLRRRGLLEDTIVLLTSDHGEELMDHGQVGHGGTLFEEVIRIPMMIRLPGGTPAGDVTESARLVDVYPTLLTQAGIEPSAGLEGRDLLQAPSHAPPLVAETRHKRTYRVSLRQNDWKYVRTYKARRVAAVAKVENGTFGLQAGMRIKAKGLFDGQGVLFAEKISVKDASDDDFEISGRALDVATDGDRLRVEAVHVVISEELGAVGLLRPIREGEWITVEGNVSREGVLLADKLERLPEDEHEFELEGVIQQIEPVPGGAAHAVIGGTTVVLDDETRIRGGRREPGAEAAPTIGPGEDPFSPERLRSGQDLRIEESLYSLAADPAEAVDLAAEDAERVAQLASELDRWLKRMQDSPQRAEAARESLDDQTVEQLRELGYLE